jgi:hypothetical protein
LLSFVVVVGGGGGGSDGGGGGAAAAVTYNYIKIFCAALQCFYDEFVSPATKQIIRTGF